MSISLGYSIDFTFVLILPVKPSLKQLALFYPPSFVVFLSSDSLEINHLFIPIELLFVLTPVLLVGARLFRANLSKNARSDVILFKCLKNQEHLFQILMPEYS